MSVRQGESLRPPVFGSVFGVFAVAATAVLMLLPIAPGPMKSLFVPHLVLVPVFFLTLRPTEGIGPVGAFAAGLSVDILTFGPLGVTAASILTVHLLLRHERQALMALPAAFRMAGFALGAGFVLALSSLAMGVLGPRGWPDAAGVGMAFAGLLAVGAGIELAGALMGPRSRARKTDIRRAKARRRGPAVRRP